VQISLATAALASILAPRQATSSALPQAFNRPEKILLDAMAWAGTLLSNSTWALAGQALATHPVAHGI